MGTARPTWCERRALAGGALIALVWVSPARAETRDTGFFLRLSLGASLLWHRASADAHEVIPDVTSVQTLDTRLSYTQRPAGFVGEAAVGWSPSPGLAFAALYVDHPYHHAEYGDIRGRALGVNARAAKDVTLSLYGLLVSFHPDAAGAFHVGGALGFATLRWENPYAAVPDEVRSTGFALGPEAGVEAYAGEGFWIGVTGRVLVGRTTKEESAETHVLVVPTLLLTVGNVGAGRKERGAGSIDRSPM